MNWRIYIHISFPAVSHALLDTIIVVVKILQFGLIFQFEND